MFNWAVDEKLLHANPLKSVKKLDEQALDEQFREFFQALLDTGCRPSEVMKVTAAQVSADFTMWVFDEHKTDRTGLKRVVYLSPDMQTLTRKLVEAYPEGSLFRSFRRKSGVRRPWTVNGVRCRFKRLRERFKKLRETATPAKRKDIPDLLGVTSYVLRHTYTTQALSNGLSTSLVASLLGHKSTKMLDEHYNHLDQAADVLKCAAAKAVQPPASTAKTR